MVLIALSSRHTVSSRYDGFSRHLKASLGHTYRWSGTGTGQPLLLEGSFEADDPGVGEDGVYSTSNEGSGQAWPNRPFSQETEANGTLNGGVGGGMDTQHAPSYARSPAPGDMAAIWPGVCLRLPAPEVPTLVVKRVYWSKKERTPTDITLVTQLSIDRLSALEVQCSLWSGVITASVYVPAVGTRIVSSNKKIANRTPSVLLNYMEEFHAAQEASGRCKLDLLYIYEEVPSIELVGLYPVNAMRNRALQAAKTDIVLLLDADFVPNRDLSDEIQAPENYEILHKAVTGGGQAIVLPAFEVIEQENVTDDESNNFVYKAIESKDAVREMLYNERIRGFHMDGFVNGHRSTDFQRWLNAAVAYPVQYEEGYEPYVIASRKAVPWYDERFKGYRKNKVVHLMHMHSLGISFVVTPRGWVVHRPHREAPTWKVTKQTGYWKHLRGLYEQVKVEMEEGSFVPAAAFRCEFTEPPKWSWY